MQPNKATAERFVELLTGWADTDVCLRLIHDREDAPAIKLRGTVNELWPQVEAAPAQGRGVFIVVNEGGDTDEDITGIRALFIDGDDIPLPQDWEWHQPPDWTVSRGPERWHAYWRVADCTPAQFSEAQKRLAVRYGSDPVIFNPSRVMRLPGTLHVKRDPVLVTLAPSINSDMSLPLAAIVDGLPPAPVAAFAREATALVELDQPMSIMRASDYLRRKPDFWPGDGPGYGMACWCRDLGLSQDKTRELFEAKWNPTGNGEWSDKITEKVENAWRFAQNKGEGVDVIRDMREAFGAILAKVPAAPERRLKMSTIEEIFSFPDPEFLLDGLLVDSENTIMGGKMKSGKTYIALDIALSVAHGLPAFESQALTGEAGAVAYFAGEGTGSFKPRILAWCRQRGLALPSRNFRLIHSVPMASHSEDELSWYMDEVIREIGLPRLTVIDTLSRAIGDLAEDNQAGALFLKMSETMHARFGGAFLSLGHFGKSAELGLRGHTSAAAGVDANWRVEMKGEDNEAKTVRLSLDNARNVDRLGPFYFGLRHVATGVKLDNGFVLSHVPAHLWDGTKVEDPLAGPRIGEMLAAHPFPMSDDQLAGFMSPRREGQAMDLWQRELKATGRALANRAGRDLLGYVVTHSPRRLWGLADRNSGNVQ